MKKLNLIIIAAAALALFTGAAIAEEKAEARAENPEMKKQTHCPVMGGKIDSTVYTDIQGQRVYHCCPGCSPELKKNPDKYFKKAAAEGIIFENIQETCPVSGKTLGEKNVFVDYEGRRIYFCCEGCPSDFEKNPQKFLQAMTPVADSEENHGHDHDDHGHDHNGESH